MKPVTNYATTYRRLFQSILDGNDPRLSYQAMAKWVADNPVSLARLPRMDHVDIQREQAGVAAPAPRGLVDLARIEQNLLVVTAAADHRPTGRHRPAARSGLERGRHALDRPGGHIGLMAGSKAKHEIWPELADWLRERSGH